MPNVESGLRKSVLALALVLAASSFFFSGRPGTEKSAQRMQTARSRPQYLPGEIIIKWKSAAPLGLSKSAAGVVMTGVASVDEVLQKYKGESLQAIFPHHARPERPDAVDLTRFFSLRYRDESDPREVAKTMQSTGAIEYAEPHFIRYPSYTPNDPQFGQQWYLRKIKADSAWDITKGDTSVIIAIVDTGVDWPHPDLAANIWRNPGEIPNNGVDDDQNGYVDDVRGWDFGGLDGTEDNDPNEDRPDHGTAVAGVASAVSDNGVGISGVGFRCKIMPVKASQDNDRDIGGAPFILYGYSGLVYAADNGASVINASWGGTGYSQFEQEIINYVTAKGALVVAAAGNEGSQTASYPSGYEHVLAVAATDPTDTKPGFSNFGPHVDVSAPGTVIYTTWKPSTFLTLSGTSFSTPIASGTAALVKSLHPTWVPDQIAQQIRVTADNIDDLNPSYARQLGRGRVNVYRAVTDNSSPGLRMASYTLSDSVGGNNDRVFDAGEAIQVVGEYINLLRPTTNVTAQLMSNDPFITVLSGPVSLGALGTFETASNAKNPFTFRVGANPPVDHRAVLSVVFNDGAYEDYTAFKVVLNPSYRDHNVNNVTLTVTSKGVLAFNDYPSNSEGKGFIYHRGGEDNLLFEGAFMVGTDQDHVVDAARGSDQGYQEADFLRTESFHFLGTPLKSDQEGLSVFTDAGAGSNRLGVRVKLNTYAFKDPPNRDFVILRYTLTNTGTTVTAGIHAGVYLDWDVGAFDRNVALYDAIQNLGYVYDTALLGSRTYVGIALLSSGAPQFRAIANNGDDSWGVYDGFSKAEKWQALSSGVGHAQAGPTDVSIVLGAGPFSLQPGDSITIGFALVAGTDLLNLKDNTRAAQQRWPFITEVRQVSSQIPLTFALYQNYPNPFNPGTVIRYDLPREARVTLSLYNILGQEVVRLVDAEQSAGQYEIPVDASRLSSGVYFYRIQAGRFSDVKRMILIR
jgi:serine protease